MPTVAEFIRLMRQAVIEHPDAANYELVPASWAGPNVGQPIVRLDVDAAYRQVVFVSVQPLGTEVSDVSLPADGRG